MSAREFGQRAGGGFEAGDRFEGLLAKLRQEMAEAVRSGGGGVLGEGLVDLGELGLQLGGRLAEGFGGAELVFEGFPGGDRASQFGLGLEDDF